MGIGAGVGAAIGGVAGAVGGVASGIIGGNAAKSAADTQSRAAMQAAQLQADQADKTRATLAPYNTAGQGSLGLLQSIFGTNTPASISFASGGSDGLPTGWSVQPDGNGGAALINDKGQTVTSGDLASVGNYLNMNHGSHTGEPIVLQYNQGGYQAPTANNPLTANGLSLTFNPVGGATFAPTQAQLESTPGYQFIKSQGLQAVQNANAAKGLGLSGAALKGAAQYAEGLAGTTLDQQQRIFQQNLANQQGIFQQNYSNIINPLEWMGNLGENAAAQTGQLGQAAVANQGNLLTSAGAASAAGQVGSANALAGGLNSAANSPLNYLLLRNALGGGDGGSGGGVENGAFDL
jgi:hypothetical protein